LPYDVTEAFGAFVFDSSSTTSDTPYIYIRGEVGSYVILLVPVLVQTRNIRNSRHHEDGGSADDLPAVRIS